jgi:hypothetical protein
MKDDGELIEIRDSHNPLIVLSENFNSAELSEIKVIEEKVKNDPTSNYAQNTGFNNYFELKFQQNLF